MLAALSWASLDGQRPASRVTRCLARKKVPRCIHSVPLTAYVPRISKLLGYTLPLALKALLMNMVMML